MCSISQKTSGKWKGFVILLTSTGRTHLLARLHFFIMKLGLPSVMNVSRGLRAKAKALSDARRKVIVLFPASELCMPCPKHFVSNRLG